MLYQKILVPIDGSACCRGALSEAVKISKVTGDVITLLHAYDSEAPNVMSSNEAFRESLLEDGRKVVAEAKKIAEAEGIKVEALLVSGDAAGQIVKTAKEGSFELIVIGARGRSKLSGLILGSVSQDVIKRAHCPVLVTK
ncbi:MAG: universal stress protein [Candidatus Bathyarchaeota archaeon]|nr:universal stress protein [Candidatus Bathyarchaeota archaeon]